MNMVKKGFVNTIFDIFLELSGDRTIAL